MADQREVVLLEVDETPALQGVGKANSALDAYEARAEKANQGAAKSFSETGEAIVRFADRGRSSIERMVAAAEKKASFAGLDKLGQINAEKEQLIQRIGPGDVDAVRRLEAAYGKLAEAQRQADNAALLRKAADAAKAEQEAIQNDVKALERRAALVGQSKSGQLAFARDEMIGKLGSNASAADIDRIRAAYQKLADAEEKTASLGDRIKAAIQNPAQAAAQGWESFVNTLGVAGVAISAVVAGAGLLGKALFNLTAEQGKSAEQMLNFSDRMGISIDKAQDLKNAADIAGVGIGGLDTGVKLLAAALEDQSGAGAKSAKALHDLGVPLLDLKGNQRDLGIVFAEALDKLSKIESQSERVRKSNELLGKGGVGLQPLIKNLQQLLEVSQQLRVNPDLLTDLAKADDSLDVMSIKWDRFKSILAANVGVPVLDSIIATTKWLDNYTKDIKTAASARLMSPDALDLKKTSKGDPESENKRQQQAKQQALELAEDQRRGAELQEQFARRQVVSLDQVTAKLDDLKKKWKELESTLSGKAKGIGASGFVDKLAEFKQVEQQIKVLEAQKKTIERLNEDPEARAKKRADDLRKSQETLLAARASLTSTDPALDERQRATAEEAAKLRKDLAEVTSRINPATNAVERFRADTRTILNIYEASFLKEAEALQKIGIKKIDEERQKLEAIIQADSKLLGQGAAEPTSGYQATRQSLSTDVQREQDAADKLAVASAGERVRRVEDLEGASLDRRRDHELSQLEQVNAITTGQKLAVEQAKAGIEKRYLQESLDRQIDVLKRRTEVEIQEAQRGVLDAGSRDRIRLEKEADLQSKVDALKTETDLKVQATADSAQVKSAEIIRSRFEQVKNSAEGLLDGLLSRTKSWGDVLRDIVKAAILTPIKEAAATWIAAMLTGTQIRSGGSSAMTGMTGGGRGLLGAIGLGGVLGGGGGSLGGGSLGGIFGGGTPPIVAQPTFSGSDGAPQTVVIGGGAGTGKISMLGTLAQYGKNLKGTLTKLGNIGYGPQGGDFGGEVAGSRFSGYGGLTGGLMLAGGGALALDGLRRGGFVGLGETTAGGALIGAKFGGPIGALIGGAIGAAAGLVRLFIKGAEDKVIEKVRSLYGLTLSKSVATQIVAMSKQSFGGNLDLTIRSPQARDLLQLYAMSTGQKWSGAPTTPQAVSLAQSGGALYQLPSYSNGTLVPSSGGTIPSIGGGNYSSPAITVVVQNQLPAESVNDYMAGKVVETVVNSPQAVQQASAKATQASLGRRESAAALFGAPGLITA